MNLPLRNPNEMEMYERILEEELCPIVRVVDEEGLYPENVLKALGESGAFQVSGLSSDEILMKRIGLIELTAKYCVSTSFLIWCHTTAISFILNSQNEYLKNNLLPLLETGRVLAGTGLSNPMKYYAGMESVRLEAKPDKKGYRISGIIPFVSNLGFGHWFGIIAQVNDNQRIMAMVHCDSSGLFMTEHKDFSGLNGTRSFTCRFNEVFIPHDLIISENADSFISLIRSSFVLTQSGMGFGLVKSCAETMAKALGKQNETNKYIGISPNEFLEELAALRQKAYSLSRFAQEDSFLSAVQIRLQAAQLTLRASQTAVLYQGAAGYYRKSDCMRRLREAMFIAVVTPAIKHLNRMLEARESVKS